MLRSTERCLLWNLDHARMYNEQIEDMSDRAIARKLSVSNLVTYDCPVVYLIHHKIFKPDSTTTPCRIVFNSSASFKGDVLNNYWTKGPDLLNNILGTLISFCENQVALT